MVIAKCTAGLVSNRMPVTLPFLRETNLKVRQALPITAELGANEDQLSTFNGMCMSAVHVHCWYM